MKFLTQAALATSVGVAALFNPTVSVKAPVAGITQADQSVFDLIKGLELKFGTEAFARPGDGQPGDQQPGCSGTGCSTPGGTINNSNVNNNTWSFSQRASAYAPSILQSLGGDCAHGFSISGGVLVFSGGIGISEQDKQCVASRLAQMAFTGSQGNPALFCIAGRMAAMVYPEFYGDLPNTPEFRQVCQRTFGSEPIVYKGGRVITPQRGTVRRLGS